ncbi:MAG: metallophosphoesterase [Bacteroidota bacterium]
MKPFLNPNFLFKTRFLLVLATVPLGFSCAPTKDIAPEGLQIAVIADVHLQDVYGKLRDTDYPGIKNPINGDYILIRTMGSQLRSTRIFNENYFAFLATLDNIVERNIKIVLLPGDFSDDGQPVHIRGLRRILNEYARLHDISFFLITGNHDVVHPFARADGKSDFLGQGGKSQPIISHPHLAQPESSKFHPSVITADIKNLGYAEIADMLGDYGFFPQKHHRYWASPFSDYTYENYTLAKAKRQASLKDRKFLTPPNTVPLPDLSYVVEPIDGLWLLALDANMYLLEDGGNKTPNSLGYRNTGLGHDNLLSGKTHLVDWVRRVVQEAKKNGKTLLAFSHYPMIDFTNGASSEIDALLIGGKMQLKRVPDKKVARIFADAGLRLHIGGHIHINDTGLETTENGNTLINVQVPSLAAYPPAYKLLTFNQKRTIEVQTIRMDSVPGFDEFFKLYEREHAYLQEVADENVWNKSILSSKSYHEFTTWHLRELVRLRFLNREWPPGFAKFLLQTSGKELLLLSHYKGTDSFGEALEKVRENNSIEKALDGANTYLQTSDLSLDDFDDWVGEDLIFDLYRLRSADQLAYRDIDPKRWEHYRLLAKSFLEHTDRASKENTYRKSMLQLMTIFQKFMNGVPSDHFLIDLKTGDIRDIKSVETH